MDTFDAGRELDAEGFSTNFDGARAADLMRRKNPAVPLELLPYLAAWLEATYWLGHSDGGSSAMTE